MKTFKTVYQNNVLLLRIIILSNVIATPIHSVCYCCCCCVDVYVFCLFVRLVCISMSVCVYEYIQIRVVAADTVSPSRKCNDTPCLLFFISVCTCLCMCVCVLCMRTQWHMELRHRHFNHPLIATKCISNRDTQKERYYSRYKNMPAYFYTVIANASTEWYASHRVFLLAHAYLRFTAEHSMCVKRDHRSVDAYAITDF